MNPLLLSTFTENIPRNDPLAIVVWTVVLIVVPLALVYCAVKWVSEDAEERHGSKVLAVIEFDFSRYKEEHKRDALD